MNAKKHFFLFDCAAFKHGHCNYKDMKIWIFVFLSIAIDRDIIISIGFNFSEIRRFLDQGNSWKKKILISFDDAFFGKTDKKLINTWNFLKHISFVCLSTRKWKGH